MIIDNDLENISHVSVIELKEEDLEELKNDAYSDVNTTQKLSREISLNLSTTKNNTKDSLLQIYFKNYIPIDKNFFIDKLEYFDKISEIENQYEKKMRKSVKDFINLEKNPLNLVPKKNNSDLKRNLAKKLEKLNRKTEIAILQIIRENLKIQKSQITEMSDKNEKANAKNVNSLLTAANMQYNLAETELLRENEEYDVDDGDGDDVSSNYDQGINDY